jgi:hypothetical protein
MFKAIGLVVLLIAVRLLMPGLFMAFDEAGTKFFRAIGRTADMVDPANLKLSGLSNSAPAGINYVPKPNLTSNSFR